MRFFHSIWQDGSASSSRHIYPSEEQYLYPLKCIMSGDNEIILQSEIKLRSMLSQPYPGNQQAGSLMPFCSMFVMLLSRFLFIIYRPHIALSFNYNHLDIYFSNQLKSFMWHNVFLGIMGCLRPFTSLNPVSHKQTTQDVPPSFATAKNTNRGQ